MDWAILQRVVTFIFWKILERVIMFIDWAILQRVVPFIYWAIVQWVDPFIDWPILQWVVLFRLQVLQIHDSARQTRVDAVDSLGRNLSLPADLPVEVTPTDGPHAGGKYEAVVDDRFCLPIPVGTAWTYESKTFAKITVIKHVIGTAEMLFSVKKLHLINKNMYFRTDVKVMPFINQVSLYS